MHVGAMWTLIGGCALVICQLGAHCSGGSERAGHDGKVYIVTGAARSVRARARQPGSCVTARHVSGFGRSFALLAARGGAAVVCADLNADGLNTTVQSVRDCGERVRKLAYRWLAGVHGLDEGGRALGIKVDVSSEEDNRRLVDECLQNFGRLDGFFAHAGVVTRGCLTTGLSCAYHQVCLAHQPPLMPSIQRVSLPRSV